MENTKQTKTVPGIALVNMIREKAKKEGRDNKWLSVLMGLSYTYANSILAGARPIGTLSRESMKAISGYLEIPLAQTLMLAEVMHPEDFFVESTLEERLDGVYRNMQADPDWRGLIPNRDEWNATPLRMRLVAAVMYEKILGQTLIEKAQLIELQA